MSDEAKQEWVFDGTRGDFWLFLGIAAFFLLSLIFDLKNLFWGYHRTMGTSWSDWMVLVALPFLAVSFYRTERLLGVAPGLLFVSTAIKLLNKYLGGNSNGLVTIFAVLRPLTSVSLLLGCGMYLKHRLRQQPVMQDKSVF